MIMPLDPREINLSFVVSDIENYESPHPKAGQLISICTAWRNDKGKIDYIDHYSWDDWWAWLKPKAKKDKRFRQIWAHNGGAWDWSSFLEWVLHHADNGEYNQITGVFGGGRAILTNVVTDDCTISLRDSYLLFRSSLAKLSEAFLPKEKRKLDLDKTPPYILWLKNRKKYFKYLRRDCEALIEIMESALQLVHTRIAPIGRFGPTIASTALEVFRCGFLQDEISTPNLARRKKDETPEEAVKREYYNKEQSEIREFLRRGYRGGRVEVFQLGRFDNVRVYDVNSLYPWAMRHCSVPISNRGCWTAEFIEGMPGCYEVEFSQPEDKPALLMINGKGEYHGRGVFYSPELERLKQIGGDFKVKTGYVFLDHSVIFRQFVDKHYQLRMENPDSKHPLNILGKWFPNNLYGKFAQRAETQSLVKVNTLDRRNKLLDLAAMGDCEIEPLRHPADDIWIVKEHGICRHEHCAIAGMITSLARTRLHEGLCAVPINSLLYCDTDSVHTTATMPDELAGKELGKFKVEFPEKDAAKFEGVYAGKKMYGLRAFDKTGKELEGKIRAKGIRVDNSKEKNKYGREKLGFALDFEMLVDMVRNQTIIACDFKSTNTARAVWRGKRANTFENRTRKIRVLNGKENHQSCSRHSAARTPAG